MNAWPLAVFCVTVVVVLYLVIAEPAVTVPATWLRCRKPWRIVLSYGYAPLVGVAVLLAAGAATGDTLKLGIAGDKYIKPYGIVILFMSQAYLCTSLDKTGVFAYIAARVTQLFGSGGHKVFAAYYIMASVLTVLTSNDVVILTLTPIVCHFAAVTKTDPRPLLFVEFYAANIWGMTLLIGNPTNIIIGEATDLSFLAFSKWSLLPTIVTGVVMYGVLVARFRRHISKAPRLEEDIDPSSLLIDPWGAKFGCIVLLASLVMLAVANFIGAPLWTITLAAAGVLVGGNLYVHYLRPWFRAKRRQSQVTAGGPSHSSTASDSEQGAVEVGAHSLRTAAVDGSASRDGGTAASTRPGKAIELVIAPQREEPTAACSPPKPAEPAGDGASGSGRAAGSSGRRFWRPFGKPRQQGRQVQATPMALMPYTAEEDAVDRADGTDSSAPGSSGAAHMPAQPEADSSTPPAAQGSSTADGSSAVGPESLSAEGLRRRPSAGDGICPGEASDEDAVTPAGLDKAAVAAASDDSREKPGFSLWATFRELPWHVVPFLFGMFIIVEALNEGQWIDYFGNALAGATSSLFVAVFLTGAIGSVLANVINNQPMTILMARVLLSAKYDVAPRQRQAANLALIAASNVGANFTLIGSLAAVMWIKLLKAKSVKMPFMSFLWMGLVTMPVPLGISLLIFWAESAVFQ